MQLRDVQGITEPDNAKDGEIGNLLALYVYHLFTQVSETSDLKIGPPLDGFIAWRALFDPACGVASSQRRLRCMLAAGQWSTDCFQRPSRQIGIHLEVVSAWPGEFTDI